MQIRRLSMGELQREVARVTLEIRKLEDRAKDMKDLFDDLENLHVEARGCCFPFNYVMLRDMVHDASEVAAKLQGKWYGSTTQPADTTTKAKARGLVGRLMESCRAFAANRQALGQFEVLLDDLSKLKKAELQRRLEERQATLAQMQVIFTQMQNLLQQLRDLQKHSQETWLIPRYFLLKRGVNDTLASFKSVNNLIDSAVMTNPSAFDSAKIERTKNDK